MLRYLEFTYVKLNSSINHSDIITVFVLKKTETEIMKDIKFVSEVCNKHDTWAFYPRPELQGYETRIRNRRRRQRYREPKTMVSIMLNANLLMNFIEKHRLNI